jgi:DNA-binding transcriptional ArsR family regulator
MTERERVYRSLVAAQKEWASISHSFSSNIRGIAQRSMQKEAADQRKILILDLLHQHGDIDKHELAERMRAYGCDITVQTVRHHLVDLEDMGLLEKVTTPYDTEHSWRLIGRGAT